jgi:hypothetical protein
MYMFNVTDFATTDLYLKQVNINTSEATNNYNCQFLILLLHNNNSEGQYGAEL